MHSFDIVTNTAAGCKDLTQVKVFKWKIILNSSSFMLSLVFTKQARDNNK